ncbi:MAG: helix-turn-helix domain-containing protein [Fidelibacterota bacterium]
MVTFSASVGSEPLVPFYTELKTLREKQEIDLQEVSNRTKINLTYLEAIESGDFSFLPHVYVRLFLRAYAIEVGAEPKDILNQLEIHLSKEEGREPPEEEIAEEIERDMEEKEPEVRVPGRTSYQIRSDLIKVALLLAVVLFAVFIIRRIVSQEGSVPPEETGQESPIPSVILE